MALLIQSPDSLSLSRNLKEVLISTSAEVRFRLKKGTAVLLDENYQPDSSGLVTLDIREVVTSSLSLSIPSTNTYEQTEAVGTFDIYLDSATQADGSFTAVLGGVSGGVNASVFLPANFLTWQAQEKTVTSDQPEWLTYYFTGVYDMKAKFYNQDGTDKTVTLMTGTAGKVFSVNCQFSRLWSLGATIVSGVEKPRYGFIDVWVENSGTRLSYVQRYCWRAETSLDRVFLCQNTIGGIDTFVFNGENKFIPELDHSVASHDDNLVSSNTKTKRRYGQNTGILKLENSGNLWDFFRSLHAYYLKDGTISPIVLDTSNIEHSGIQTANSWYFEYRLSDDDGLLKIQRSSSFPAIIEMPGPDEGTYYLVPRLVDYPTAVLNDNLLLMIQSPFSQSWMQTSIGALKDYINPVKRLTQLADVSITNPATGQVLTWDGEKWTNTTPGTGSLFEIDGDDVKPKENRNIKTPAYLQIGTFKFEEETIEVSGGATIKRLKISRTDSTSIPANMYITGGISAYGDGPDGVGSGGDAYWMQDPTDGRLHVQLRAVLTGGTTTEDGDLILYAARGAANGVASLDENGKVPSSQAPASIIEGYYYLGVFYYNSSHTSVITGEEGRLYVDLTDASASAMYRWTGTEYSLVGSGTVIGAKITSDGNPLTVDSGYIIFPYAAANVDGAISSSEQYFTGIKHIDDGIQIGPIKISYDSVNSALRFENTTSGSLANLYTTGGISSYGDGPGGGGGGASYLYQLSDVQDYRTSYRGKLLKSKDDGSGVEWVDVPNSAVWGNISGTLSEQTDLQAELDAKVSANDPITSAQKCKITYDSKGLITAGTDLVLTDMPQEIQTLYADFNDMFRKVTSGSDFIIEAKKDMYSVGGLSAYGNGQGGSGGAAYLYQLSDIPDYRTVSNKVLKVNSSHSLVWSDESSGGANVQWGTESSDTVPLSVDGATKTLIMSHQSLSNYYTKTEMDTALSNKASTDHTHTLSNITDFTISALNGLTAPTHFVFCTSYPSYQPSDTIYFKVEAV